MEPSIYKATLLSRKSKVQPIKSLFIARQCEVAYGFGPGLNLNIYIYILVM